MSDETIVELSDEQLIMDMRSEAKLLKVKGEDYTVYYLEEAANRLEAATATLNSADEVISDVHVANVDCDVAAERIRRYWKLRSKKEKKE